MKNLIKVILLSLLLTSCTNNNNSISNYNSSSFKGYDDISTTLVDPGSYEYINNNEPYVVGKVETAKGERINPFNTEMSLTMYSENVCYNLSPIYDYNIKRLHILFDRYNEYKDENGNIINNLKVVNDSYASNRELIIDKDLYEVLKLSIELSKLTKGYFNPTMGSLIDGWNQYFSPFGLTNESFTITTENNLISRKESIVDYNDLENILILMENNGQYKVKFNKYEKAGFNSVIISLGAIAKGYAIEYLRQKFERHNVPLILSGSASSTYIKGINPNPLRDNWGIQINSPYKDSNIGLFSIPLLVSEIPPERAISTSGDSEQLFYYEHEGELIRRHHILNPYSGHSENYYRSITLYAEKRSDILDGLSTALFNIDDFDIIKEIIVNIENYYDINIDYLFQKEVGEREINLYLDEGFEKTINMKFENDGKEENKDYAKINGIVRIDL